MLSRLPNLLSVGRWQEQGEDGEQVVFQAGEGRQVPLLPPPPLATGMEEAGAPLSKQGLLATCNQKCGPNFEGDRIKKNHRPETVWSAIYPLSEQGLVA